MAMISNEQSSKVPSPQSITLDGYEYILPDLCGIVSCFAISFRSIFQNVFMVERHIQAILRDYSSQG